MRLTLLRLIGSILGHAARRDDPGARLFPADSAHRRPRLLLIRPDHLGDALLAAPAGRALREALPGAQVDWLVGPWTAEMIRRGWAADEVLTCEFPGFTRRPKGPPWAPYVELARQAARLGRRRYDLALVLRPDHWWGAMLATAAGIPRRIGYAVAECRPFLTQVLPSGVGLHVADQSLALAGAAVELLAPGATITSPAPGFAIRPEERAWAATVAAGAAARDGSPLVAIHPGSGATVKDWLPIHWQAVVTMLADRAGAAFVLTGGRSESGLLSEIADGIEPRPTVLAGRTSLGQLAALFERCALVLGGDSGPLHLAAAVGARTIRVYGPTDVALFGPRGDAARHRVLRAALPCQPCGNLVDPPCGAVSTPACLRAVSPGQVTASALALLVALPSHADRD